MSSSGMPSSRVALVSAPAQGTSPEQEQTTVSSKLPRQPKVAFESQLPAWLMAGKPARTGLLRAIWWLYARLSLYKFSWIPQPPSILNYGPVIIGLQKEINDMRRHSMAIIAVLTTKGGATKTTVSTWLSATLASVNHSSVAIFDVDRGGGKVAKRFGFNPKNVMTTDKFVNHVVAGESFDHSTLVRMTESDPLTGVTIFHSQPGQSITAERMEMALTVLKTELHTLVIDTGPGVRVPSTNASAIVSNVQVVVGNGNSGDDLSDIAATLAHQPYRLAESYAQDEDGNVMAFNIKSSVVIAISGLHRLKCNTRSQYAFAEQYGVKPEQIVLIPFNRYLRQTGRVRLSALEPRTLHAFYQLAARTAHIAVSSNK